MTRAPRRGRAVPALVLAVALALTGCAAATPDLATDAAARLQQEVLAVSTASAGGSLDEALAGLDTTEDELDAALAADEISPKRYRQVREAIRLVRSDLDEAVAAAKAKAEADAAAAESQRQAALAQQIADLQNQQNQQAADAAAAEDSSGDSSAGDSSDDWNSGDSGDSAPPGKSKSDPKTKTDKDGKGKGK